jgi:hypothetical protein
LRDPEKIRLWIAFCEDWCNADNEEAVATSMAAAGTLAVAAGDNAVSEALLKDGCAIAIVSMMESQVEGLVHRALVLALEFVQCGGVPARDHLGEQGIVAVLSKLLNNSSSLAPNLKELCRNLAEAMIAVDSKA